MLGTLAQIQSHGLSGPFLQPVDRVLGPVKKRAQLCALVLDRLSRLTQSSSDIAQSRYLALNARLVDLQLFPGGADGKKRSGGVVRFAGRGALARRGQPCASGRGARRRCWAVGRKLGSGGAIRTGTLTRWRSLFGEYVVHRSRASVARRGRSALAAKRLQHIIQGGVGNRHARRWVHCI